MSLLSITRITAWVRRKASRAWFSLTPRGSAGEFAAFVVHSSAAPHRPA